MMMITTRDSDEEMFALKNIKTVLEKKNNDASTEMLVNQ